MFNETSEHSLFKTIQQDVWAFDMEWVPDPAAGRLLYDLPADMSDLDVVGEMWARNGATEEDPTPFLKTALCRVVSIAAVQRRVRNDEVSLNLLWLPRDPEDVSQQDEKQIIGRFLSAAGKHRPQLVGFNSTASDLKILIQRAVILGVEAGEFCKRPDKPWEGPDYFARSSDAHVDLVDLLGGWGKSGVSLHELATLSGIPGKMGTTGDDVAKQWLSGQWKSIIDYNCYDALTTYLVWLRTCRFGGFLTGTAYEEEQDRVRDLLMEMSEEPGQEYLGTYFDRWEQLLDATGQHPIHE